MARPIKETPILFGEDARRFEERMNQVRKETPEERERRQNHYNVVLKWFKNAEEDETAGRIVKNTKVTAG